MNFVYFIPAKSDSVRPTERSFKELGLGHAIGPAGNPTSRFTSNGPTGLSGWICSCDHGTRADYEPEKQIWRPGPKSAVAEGETPPPKFFVGMYTTEPPSPLSLKRDKLIPGEEIALGDGNLWTIPIALSFVAGRGSTLPARFVIGDDGVTWNIEQSPEFAHITRHAEAIVDAYAAAEKQPDGRVAVKIDFEQSMKICLDALAVNYRGLGPIEVSLLGLITTETRWLILRALIDDLTKEKVDALGEKKTDIPATSAT